MGRRSTAPNELTVLVAFRQYAYEAGLAIECPTDVGWGDTCVAPCGGDGDAHEVCRKVSCAMVETADSGDGAPGDLVEAGAACRRRGSESVGVVGGRLGLKVMKWMGGPEVCQSLEYVQWDAPLA